MYTLPELPYNKSAFTPFITEEGFDYHHGKHHQSYVDKLNGIVQDTELSELDLFELIKHGYNTDNMALFNNAAQHYNHWFYWHCMSPNGGGRPQGRVADLIKRDFGSFDQFKDLFSDAAAKLFGSGWAWLVLNENGRLSIDPMKDAHTPVAEGKCPLLTLDVWEHAYYIDHRNQRPKFIEGFWDIINWDFVDLNLEDTNNV